MYGPISQRDNTTVSQSPPSCSGCKAQHPPGGDNSLLQPCHSTHRSRRARNKYTKILLAFLHPSMATKPYFLWGDTPASSDPDAAAFGSGAPETALLPAAAATATAAADTAVVSPEHAATAAVARPRLRRNASGSGKQQQQAGGGGGAKKPPQRGLGVAELERLRCGGDPLSAVLVDAAGAQGHPLLHFNHHHHPQMPPSAFDAGTGARYCSQLLTPAPPPPPGPVCLLHSLAAATCQRAPLMAPEQQYFRDRWGRMGGFSPAGNGAGGGVGADHQAQLLPAPLAPEHPSSQNTIWRPATSSSSCLQTGHRCDICCRRMRALAERGPLAPAPPASPNAGANTNAMADYSIYDLAAAMASARQGDALLAQEKKGAAAAASAAEAPAKKDVREIQFFPAASAQHTGGGGGRVSVPDEPDLAAPFSSPYGAAAAAGRAAPQLDLSLRL